MELFLGDSFCFKAERIYPFVTTTELMLFAYLLNLCGSWRRISNESYTNARAVYYYWFV